MENPIIIPNISISNIKELSKTIYELKLEVLRQIAQKTGKDVNELKKKYLTDDE